MQFVSEASAKAFFISKILQQAEKEGIVLSKAQRYMLSWSESDPSFVLDNELNEQFEKKIQTLIKQAYEENISKEKDMKETYREAYKALKQGDHFILIIIDAAIGSNVLTST